MSFLIDTNICSALYRRPGKMAHRFSQHAGSLFIPTVVLGELLTWYHQSRIPALIDFIRDDLLQEVTIVDFDSMCAEKYGMVRGDLLRRGITVLASDSMIASVALVYDFTLVTHNTADFENIPGLRLDDWLSP